MPTYVIFVNISTYPQLLGCLNSKLFPQFKQETIKQCDEDMNHFFVSLKITIYFYFVCLNL